MAGLVFGLIDRMAEVWLAMELADAKAKQHQAETELGEIERAQAAVRRVDAAGLAGLERLRGYYAHLKR